MAIELARSYTTNLDEVYMNAGVTSVLDGGKDISYLAQSNTFMAPALIVGGMADYTRNSGYTDGDVSLTYTGYTPNYDRGIRFTVDYLDNQENAGIVFGKLGATFVREKATPELDAFRLSKYASKTGISTVTEYLATGEAVLNALVKAKIKMDDDQVPAENRILFITPNNLEIAKAVDLTKNTGVLSSFVIKVTPSNRLVTAVALSKTNGFAKASNAKDINFMAIQKDAVIQKSIRNASSIITPDNNADSDGYVQKFRSYGIAEVYKNKVAGIYVSITGDEPVEETPETVSTK